MKTKYSSIKLLFLFVGMLLFSCSSDDNNAPETPETYTDEELIEITARVIRNAGLDFPSRPSSGENENRLLFDWPPSDYVKIIHDSDESFRIQLWLDDENNIIPTPEWRASNPNYCSDQHKYMRGAKYMLQFKVFEVPRDGILSVQLNYIEVDTQRIKYSVYVDWYSSRPGWLYDAMSDVWNQMLQQTTINGAVDPCRDQRPYKFYFNSVATFETEESLNYESFAMDFDLTYNSEIEAYVGSADFVWLEGWSYGKAEGIYIPWPPEKGGTFEVLSLKLPTATQDAEMIFRVPAPAQNRASFLFIAFAQFYEFVEVSGDNIVYRLSSNWVNLGDDDMVMGAYLDHSHSEQGGILKETTTMEIGMRD